MDRRTKLRFPIERELRYKLLQNDKIVATGQGETVNMSSGGIAFRTAKVLAAGDYIELSIAWPELLDGTCPVRLVVYGKVARRSDSLVASTVEKWEFRTGSRQLALVVPMRIDNRLMRWMEYRNQVTMKMSAAPATA